MLKEEIEIRIASTGEPGINIDDARPSLSSGEYDARSALRPRTGIWGGIGYGQEPTPSLLRRLGKD